MFYPQGATVTGTRTRHTALAVCLSVALLGFPVVFAATAEAAIAPDLYVADFATGTMSTSDGEPGYWCWSPDTSVANCTEDVSASPPAGTSYSLSNIRIAITLPSDHTVEHPNGNSSGNRWTEVVTCNSGVTVSLGTVSSSSYSATETPAVRATDCLDGVAKWGIYRNGLGYLEDTQVPGVELTVQGDGGGFDSSTCPDTDELVVRAWANWTGDHLTAVVQVDQQAWREFTAMQPSFLKEYPQPDEWTTLIALGDRPLWSAFPDGFVRLGSPPTGAAVGPDGVWTGVYNYRWTTDPAGLANLDGDGVFDDPAVVIQAAAAPDGDDRINPPCMLVVPLGDIPADQYGPPAPPPPDPTGGDEDDPGTIEDGDEPSCAIWNLVACLKWLLVPSEDSLSSISESMDLVDTIPFSYALDFADWVGQINDQTDPGHNELVISFDFSPITGREGDRITLLSESGGYINEDGNFSGCMTETAGNCPDEAVPPTTRILRGMRWLMAFVVWGGTGLAFFRIVGRGTFSLGGTT